jgi:hypothetical protein
VLPYYIYATIHPFMKTNCGACVICCLLLFCLVEVTKGATTFDYSYNFGDGNIVSGTITGTQNGNLVESITAATVFFNGTLMPGTVFAEGTGTDGQFHDGAAVFSFDMRENNFLLLNSDYANHQNTYTWYLQSFQEPFGQPPYIAIAFPNGTLDFQNYADTSSWSLTPSAVPEPSTVISGALLLLPFGFSLVRHYRAKSKAWKGAFSAQ